MLKLLLYENHLDVSFAGSNARLQLESELTVDGFNLIAANCSFTYVFNGQQKIIGAEFYSTSDSEIGARMASFRELVLSGRLEVGDYQKVWFSAHRDRASCEGSEFGDRYYWSELGRLAIILPTFSYEISDYELDLTG